MYIILVTFLQHMHFVGRIAFKPYIMYVRLKSYNPRFNIPKNTKHESRGRFFPYFNVHLYYISYSTLTILKRESLVIIIKTLLLINY